MHNPFKGWKVTGNWLDHVGTPAYPAKGSTGYSAGGTDYPLPYGTALPAPASGTLRISGGTGEFAAGQIGSAGRRSILILDEPIRDLVAIVFQHQAKFGDAKHYDEGATLGQSGASANGKDFGGDIHLHIHGLDKHGNRLDFTLYADGSTVAAETAKPIVADVVARILEGEIMIVKRSATKEVAIFGADFAEADGSKRGRHVFASKEEYNAYKSITETVRREGGVAVTLPALDSPQIVGLDETGWRTVCNVHGV